MYERCIGESGENASYAEKSSSICTKEILGYLWPLALLKKHDRPIPKKLTTIQHQGKQVKGQILEEWILGALDSQ